MRWLHRNDRFLPKGDIADPRYGGQVRGIIEIKARGFDFPQNAG
jgi:hypothetical protein